MSDSAYMPRRAVPHGVVRADLAPSPVGPSSLADVLERVLDKGIVIAGDIQVNLLDIELLTIKIRLLVASVDRAKEMGINWWEGDPTLTSKAHELERENGDLRARLDRLEERLGPTAEAHVHLEAPESERGKTGERTRASATAESGTAKARSKTTETRR